MGSEQGADYYDALYRDPDSLYALPVEDQPWTVLWREIAGRIGKAEGVVDMGCGRGQLTEYLHDPYFYVGFDFSLEAIDLAADAYPEWRFEWADITKGLPPIWDVYVFSEVLEHITDDLGVLAKVPTGARVILTVPSKDDVAHVRRFKTRREAIGRYQGLIDIRDSKTISGKWHLIEGVRR